VAEYRGKKVTLNKPRRIKKGDPGYGKRKRKVEVRARPQGRKNRVRRAMQFY
jgi:hypothetical protein